MYRVFSPSLSSIRTPWLLAMMFMLSGAIALQRNLALSFPIGDAFHYGEFVAASMAVLVPPPFDGSIYTIHGAVDLFPALLARLLAGQDHMIAYTVIMYPLMSLLACAFVALAAVRIARRSRTDLIFLAPFLLLLPFGVGWRDLFFAVSLFLFSGLISTGASRSVAAQVLFGVIIAFGTYWSYNRGVLALAAFGPVMLWLSIFDRRHLVSVVVAIVAFPALGMVLPGIGVTEYVNNFLMLLETASQWRYPPSASRTLFAAVTIVGFVSAVAVAAMAVRGRTSDRGLVALNVALFVAAALYVKIGLGRIDLPHIAMATWLPLLIALCSMRWGPVEIPDYVAARFAKGVLVLVFTIFLFAGARIAPLAMVMICILTFVGAFVAPQARFMIVALIVTCTLGVIGSSPLLALRAVLRGNAAWVISLSDLPANDAAVTEQVLWVAREITDAGAGCVFDLGNTGLINAVAGLPSCSRFTYPVYATSAFEDTLIADLLAAAPPVILYRSTFWSYAIDGRPMSERFPELDAAIMKDYPREICNLGACLRYRD